MRKAILLAGICFSIALVFYGCLKDTCKNRYTIYTPVYKTLTQVRAHMKAELPQPLVSPAKMYISGNYIFLNEPGKGIHIIDNSNPAAPKNLSFINIPGNVDLAVKGNYLYADSYSDIAVFDISSPTDVRAVKFYDNVLKGYNGIYWGNTRNPDSVQVLTGYNQRDTVVDCSVNMNQVVCRNCGVLVFSAADKSYNTPAAAAAPAAGISGSMARFTITKDYLYAVSPNTLFSFSLADPANPSQTSSKAMGWNIETVYPFKDKLFLGSTSGMFIYDITNPSSPVQEGQFSHVRSCDPVIAEDTYAYVTLRSGTTCLGYTNELDVLNIANLNSPYLVQTYAMTNPKGLSKDGNLLFICDGSAGLKIYNSARPIYLELVKTFDNMDAYDVIAYNGIAVVTAKDGLYEFDYSNPGKITQISHLAKAN
jgi:hypothetical protein